LLRKIKADFNDRGNHDKQHSKMIVFGARKWQVAGLETLGLSDRFLVWLLGTVFEGEDHQQTASAETYQKFCVSATQRAEGHWPPRIPLSIRVAEWVLGIATNSIFRWSKNQCVVAVSCF
jgi:hypothetical protein